MVRISSVLVLLFVGPYFNTEVRGLEIDAYCDPSRVPFSSSPTEYDYNRCDASRGLYCNQYTSRCSCYVLDSEYDTYYGRCLGRVGNPCKATPSFSIQCGENAECRHDTGFCQCREGYLASYDRRICTSGGAKLKISLFLSILPTLIIFISLMHK